MSASEGDRQDSECFPQAFKPLDLRQRLLDILRADNVTQPGPSLKSEYALARRPLPHLFLDLLLGFLGEQRDDPTHVHAAHSNESTGPDVSDSLTWPNAWPRVQTQALGLP